RKALECKDARPCSSLSSSARLGPLLDRNVCASSCSNKLGRVRRGSGWSCELSLGVSEGRRRNQCFKSSARNHVCARCICSLIISLGFERSEERRVGKESRSRWSRD